MAEKGGHWVKSAGGGMSFVAAGGGASGASAKSGSGSPFKVGDYVEVTKGPALGRKGTVTDFWWLDSRTNKVMYEVFGIGFKSKKASRAYGKSAHRSFSADQMKLVGS